MSTTPASSTTPTLTTDDEKAVYELHLGFVNANRTADTAFLRANMVGGDELIWENLNKSTYVGVDHICRLWDYIRHVTNGVPAQVETHDEKVSVVGDLAWVHSKLSFWADFGVHGKVTMPSRMVEIWQRIDGEWKMVYFHCSSHEPGGWEGGL